VVRSISGAIVALIGSLALAQAAPAQIVAVPESAVVGTRVRVFAPELRTDRYVGRIKSLDEAVMVLDTGEVRSVFGIGGGPVLVDQYRRVTIRLSNIESVEVSSGRTFGEPTVRGAIFGALIGGVLVGLGSMPETNPDANDFLRGVPPGMAIGGLVGGLIGWKIGGERWVPGRLPGRGPR
jgi:hypothetical protein